VNVWRADQQQCRQKEISGCASGHMISGLAIQWGHTADCVRVQRLGASKGVAEEIYSVQPFKRRGSVTQTFSHSEGIASYGLEFSHKPIIPSPTMAFT